jgi:ApbE superfamily uncharacterized protein (UPF0280 family)
MYEARSYRDWVAKSGLVSFQVAIRESDLMIRAHRDLRHQASDLTQQARDEIEEEIRRRPVFRTSLAPLPMPVRAGPVVRAMIESARLCDVGPMAAVAGAVAQFVGEGLLRWTPEVIVENGGDIYLKMNRPVEMGLYAGDHSPYTGEIKLKVNPAGLPGGSQVGALGVCTSSGTVGHSLSFGRSDAIVTVAADAALADAAATAIGNRILSPDDVEKTLREEQERGLLKGLLIAIGVRMGAFGEIEILR